MHHDEFLRTWLENRDVIWCRIYSITRERDATDDLFQDLFIRVYRRLDGIDETPIRYIMKAAGNLARSYLKSSYYRGTMGYKTDSRVTTVTPFDYVRDSETEFYQQRVQPALQDIPEKFRAALDAYTGDERPLHVAKRTGIPMSTLLSRKKRALELLRERMNLEK